MISVKGNLTGKLNTTYTKIYPELENLTVTPSEEQQKFIHEDRYGYDKVVVNPIPDKYIIPSGTLDITENGNYNVKEKEFANVNVPTKTLGTKTITSNGTYKATDDNLDGYSEVNVEIGKYAPRTISFQYYTGEELNYEISNLNIKNIVSMYGMFGYCYNLTSLDLSSFNTSNVTNMTGMFRECYALTSLNLSNFNTSKLTSMNVMFDYCSSLTSLDLSSFDTSNVTEMQNVFNRCSKLTSLNLSSFNTSKVTDMYGMFTGCSSLTSLDLSSFNTSNVTNMTYMFSNCSSLTSLNISNFDFTNVTSYSQMFYGVPNDCYILVKDATAKEWITSKFSNLTNVHYVGEIE